MSSGTQARAERAFEYVHNCQKATLAFVILYENRTGDSLRTRAFAVGAGILIAAGCTEVAGPDPASGSVTQASSPIEVWLAIGDEVRVDSLVRVRFTSVRGDSRCPTAVSCMWAGDGAVEIQHAVGLGPSYPDTLHTTLEPRSVSLAGYVITLLDLAPYPDDPDPIPPDEYAARFRIERAAR